MKESSSKKPQKSVAKLIGWLVTYGANEKGSYHELREGRIFIGSGVIEGEKLIALDGKEFTTAHAVLSASNEGKVVLQDLFSNSGTFISRRTSGDEVQVSGPADIENGDWVRFGEDVKFQVCLIDGCSK